MRACIHFLRLPDEKIELYFMNPIQTLIAGSPEEVTEVIRQAEQLAKHHYVIGYLPYEALSYDERINRYAVFYVFDQTVDKEQFEARPVQQSIYFSMTETKETVTGRIEQIKDEIRAGNTYQTNYTTRLTAETDVDAYSLYHHLTQAANGAYTAFIESDEDTIVSISPELFFQLEHGHLITKPMKGTMPRSSDPDIDRHNYAALVQSTKDKAENVMIVDLLRNDLSRIAERNSVHVSSLFDVSAYPTVFQMTSTVEADTSAGLDEIMKALFPCGSITGAPKRKTMEIIDRMESDERYIYCGTIGILTADYTIFNVPIRTMYKRHNQWIYGVGGGITIDSDAELEFQEMIAKSAIIRQLKPAVDAEFHLIETMRIGPEGIKRGHYHRNRLQNSMERFGLAYNEQLLDQLFSLTSAEEQMMRLTVYDSYLSYAVNPLPAATSQTARLKLMAEHNHDKLEYKTSIRQHYDQELTLYYNDDRFITEFNIGNFVFRDAGQYYTPELPGMLKGCMRQQLLDAGVITIRNISVDALQAGHYECFMINSLREWTEVKLCFD